MTASLGFLLDIGPSTTATLGEQLGLSPAAIRATSTPCWPRGRSWSGSRDGGVRAGAAARRDCSPCRSADTRPVRPPTTKARATQALRFLVEAAGEPAVREFAERRAREAGHRLDRAVAAADSAGSGYSADSGDSGDDPGQRASAVAEALSAAGYAETVSALPSGTQLCQHHCPVHSVAAQFPQMCEAETKALARLLGTHVQRLATIAHGDGVCTTHIPLMPKEPPHNRACHHDLSPRRPEGTLNDFHRCRATGRPRFLQVRLADSDAYADDVTRGLSEAVVRDISARKSEPRWMLDLRLKGLKLFERKPMPTWGADLSGIKFDSIKYFVRSTEKQAASWDELPADIKNTYDKLGIPEAEKQRLIAGVAAQYESEVVYHKIREDLESQGVLFLDTDTGLREHEDSFGSTSPR